MSQYSNELGHFFDGRSRTPAKWRGGSLLQARSCGLTGVL